jgi:short-subunit dehydrogenase
MLGNVYLFMKKILLIAIFCKIVNNVGVMYEMPMELCELSPDVIWQHVNINMGSLTMMCWLVLPQMLQRRRGAIVNLSSSSSVGPLPYMNIYSASKVSSTLFYHE